MASYNPHNLINGNGGAYWATDDSVTTPEVTLDLPSEQSFNLVRLRENIHLGQRISQFEVHCWRDNQWVALGQGTSVGLCRILRVEQPVRTARVRLKITEASACPALTEFALFAEA